MVANRGEARQFGPIALPGCRRWVQPRRRPFHNISVCGMVVSLFGVHGLDLSGAAGRISMEFRDPR